MPSYLSYRHQRCDPVVRLVSDGGDFRKGTDGRAFRVSGKLVHDALGPNLPNVTDDSTFQATPSTRTLSPRLCQIIHRFRFFQASVLLWCRFLEWVLWAHAPNKLKEHCFSPKALFIYWPVQFLYRVERSRLLQMFYLSSSDWSLFRSLYLLNLFSESGCCISVLWERRRLYFTVSVGVQSTRQCSSRCSPSACL